jgi:hypothetical protein
MSEEHTIFILESMFLEHTAAHLQDLTVLIQETSMCHRLKVNHMYNFKCHKIRKAWHLF